MKNLKSKISSLLLRIKKFFALRYIQGKIDAVVEAIHYESNIVRRTQLYEYHIKLKKAYKKWEQK